jgi:hypothetical protein
MNIEDPVTDEDFISVWRAPAAVTISEVYCETVGGSSVLFDYANDDSAVNGSEISCTTSGTTDSTMGGDATVAVSGLIDVNIGAVTGPVEAVSLCFEYTFD